MDQEHSGEEAIGFGLQSVKFVHYGSRPASGQCLNGLGLGDHKESTVWVEVGASVELWQSRDIMLTASGMV